MDIESEYLEKKGSYDKVAVGLEMDKLALEKECDTFQVFIYLFFLLFYFISFYFILNYYFLFVCCVLCVVFIVLNCNILFLIVL